MPLNHTWFTGGRVAESVLGPFGGGRSIGDQKIFKVVQYTIDGMKVISYSIMSS